MNITKKETGLYEVNWLPFLNAVLSLTDEMITLVDREGYLMALSRSCAKFLGVERDAAVGRYILDVVDDTRLPTVLQNGSAELNNIQIIKGQRAVTARIPVRQHGELIGALGCAMIRGEEDPRLLFGKIVQAEMDAHLYKIPSRKVYPVRRGMAKYTVDDILGDSVQMRAMRDTVRKIAATKSGVMISGESGTGKELIAHSIHNAGRRMGQPFICVNCGAIPANLMESELFGYVGGAFTGARREGKMGLFQAAHGGTIFLDEICELSGQMQVALLRVLQENEIQKIGAHVAEAVDVRVIAATNRSIREMIQEGRFRADLYYRLNVINLCVPPLRERRNDIPILARAFLEKLARREKLQVIRIAPNAMEYLKRYDWPGNVRELENTMERAVNFVDDDRVIRVSHLPAAMTGTPDDARIRPLKDILDDAEREAIAGALLRSKGRKTAAAGYLKISRSSLYEKMQKHGLDFFEKSPSDSITPPPEDSQLCLAG